MSEDSKPSEKLKALPDVPGGPDRYDDIFPLILAVVETAETVDTDLYYDPPLHAALVALNKALP